MHHERVSVAGLASNPTYEKAWEELNVYLLSIN
jgi:hypothetical protein